MLAAHPTSLCPHIAVAKLLSTPCSFLGSATLLAMRPSESFVIIFTKHDVPKRFLIMGCDPVNQLHGMLYFGLPKAIVCECKL